MNADLFYLLALQQASRGCKRCISPPVPLSRVVPGHTKLVPNLRLWVGLADRCQGPTRAQLKDESRSALLPMPPSSSVRPRALGPAPLDFATCRLSKEPSPTELELK